MGYADPNVPIGKRRMIVSLRFTDEQMAMIVAAAGEAGLTVSEF
jgi:uncharacterized protein (DUF1778 family)